MIRPVVGALATLVLLSAAARGDEPIDDFDGPPQAWTTFGATTSSFALGPGHSGQGGQVAFDLSDAGWHTTAGLEIDLPQDGGVPAEGLSFWMQVPAGVIPIVSVTGTTGQQALFRPDRPLWAWDAGGWFPVTVALDSCNDEWPDGGAAQIDLGNVTQIQVGVWSDFSPRPGLSGTIAIDDVVAVDPLVLDLTRPPPLAPLPPADADIAARLGTSPDMTDPTQVAMIQVAGFTWYRMGTAWADVETSPGVYDFGAVDSQLAAVLDAGFTPTLLLAYNSYLYAANWNDAVTTAADANAYVAFAAATAGHVLSATGRHLTYEVWNEPNSGGFWAPDSVPDGGVPALEYAVLAQATTAAIKQVDPEAKVTVGALSGLDLDFLTACIDAGCATGADNFSVHPYLRDRPEDIADLMFTQETLARVAPGLPMTWGERGYASYTGEGFFAPATANELQARQGIFVARELLLGAGMGIPLLVYYNAAGPGTDPTNPEDNYWLINSGDDSPKLAYLAAAQLADVAHGRALAGVPMVPSNLRTLAFQGPADTVYAVWSDATGLQDFTGEATPSTGRTPVAVPASATVADVWGAPVLPTPGDAGREVSVSEAAGPIYVTVPKALPSDAGADAGAPADGGAADAGFRAGLDAGASDAGAGDGGSAMKAPPTTSNGCGCQTADGESLCLSAVALAQLFGQCRRRRLTTRSRRMRKVRR